MKIFSPLKDGPILSMCVDVGRSSMVGPKVPHEVRSTVQKGFGLGIRYEEEMRKHESSQQVVSGELEEK